MSAWPHLESSRIGEGECWYAIRHPRKANRMDGNDSARHVQGPPPHPPEDRLDSWKEIAAYLRRDESTVRRWEKDGLPVHRHRHKLRAAVFAYKSELDSWWKNAEHEARESRPVPEAAPDLEGGSTLRLPGRLAALLLVAILVGSSVYWIWHRPARAALAHRNIMLAVLPLQNLSG